MTVQTVTLELPEAIYRQARQLAAATRQPVETFLQQSIAHSLPPLDDVSPADAVELARLASLDDSSLWREARQTMTDGQQAEMRSLLERQSQQELDAPDRERLRALMDLYGRMTVRKAHAHLLLARRGYRVPMQEQSS